MTDIHLIREEKTYFFSHESLEELGRVVDAFVVPNGWGLSGIDITYDIFDDYTSTITIERWINA